MRQISKNFKHPLVDTFHILKPNSFSQFGLLAHSHRHRGTNMDTMYGVL